MQMLVATLRVWKVILLIDPFQAIETRYLIKSPKTSVEKRDAPDLTDIA
jgi:hypothetical protein